LLLGLDRGTTDEVTLTHDVLANLLGVSRDGVTKAMYELQRSGTIHYYRGHIRVINRADLEARCCECYDVMKRESDRLQGRFADVVGLRGRNECHYPTSVPTMRNAPTGSSNCPRSVSRRPGGQAA
jgi:Crp-like helix-turn-helix domain